MGVFDKNKFASNNQSWETPDDLFKKINDEFNFTRNVKVIGQKKTRV